MDATDVRERVESAMDTELTRLGSDKVLLAATSANLATGPVLAALDSALNRHHAALTTWAATEPQQDIGDAFDEAAQTVASARVTLGAEESAEQTVVDLVQFGDPTDDFERVGAGLLAGPLIVDRVCLQAVSFFVNEADREHADRCRSVREQLGAVVETELPAATDACQERSEWEAIETGAIAAIEASYTVYADTLGQMGLDPKPVC